MSSTEELEQTYEALKVLLEDKETFEHVCGEVFNTIDSDHDGSIGKGEIKDFINSICREIGMKATPDDNTIHEVFVELDQDKDNDVSKGELKNFLRNLFIT